MAEAAPNIVHAVAGSVASSFAMTLTYPLDQIRTILQNKAGKRAQDTKEKSTMEEMLEIYQIDGISGFYRGLAPVVQTIGISNFLYFYIFEAFKTRCPAGPVWSLLASCIAGTINMAFTEPLWKTCTRIQSSSRAPSPKKSIEDQALRTSDSRRYVDPRDTVQSGNGLRGTSPRKKTSSSGAPAIRGRISGDNRHEWVPKGSSSTTTLGTHPSFPSSSSSGQRKRYSQNLVVQTYRLGKEEGLLELWQGFFTSVWLTSNPVVQFFVYDWIKIIRTQPKPETGEIVARNLTGLEAFFVGMVAKAIATLVTYPLQVAQTQLRARKPGEESTMLKCMQTVVGNSGLKGLFQGLVPKLGHASLTAAFMFLFYERILKLIHVWSRGKRMALKK